MPMLIDVPDPPAGVSFPVAAADLGGEARHPLEHGVHLGHDVLAVDQDRLALGRAQGDVQDGAVLGDVDLLAAKHRVDAVAQARFLGELLAGGRASRR